MENYQQQKDTLLHLFTDILAFSQSQGDIKQAELLREGMERLEQEKLFVVVAGEFKQGKSSMLAAMLDEPHLFPANPDIATCLISTISYAPQEQVTVFVEEDGSVGPKSISRDEIPNYVTERRNRHNVQQARLLKIETPNSYLKNGLVLVDTPGTGGLFKRHSEITYAFLSNADAVLYVSDALSPLSVIDLEFVQKIAGQCPRMLFALTKTDLSSQEEYSTIVESNRTKLVQTLNRATEEICIVPVSSEFKLSYLESKDEDDLIESNFLALEHELWTMLGESSDILLKRALLVSNQALMTLQTTLNTEKAALQHDPQVEEQKQRLHTLRERIHQFEGSKSEWRIQLQRGVHSIARRLHTQLQHEIVAIQGKLDTYLDAPQLLHDPDVLLNKVEQDIYTFMSTLDRMLNEHIAQLRSQMEEATELGLSLPSVALTNYTRPVPVIPSGTIQETRKKMGLWDRLMLGMTSGNRESSSGSTIGKIIGFVLGLGVDIFTGSPIMGRGRSTGSKWGENIGRVIGYKSGIARGLEDIQSRELNEVRMKVGQAARHFIDQSRIYCDSTLAETMEQVELEMAREFVSLIEQERIKGEELLCTINEAQRLSQDEASKRLAILNPSLQQAHHLTQRLDSVARTIAAHIISQEDDRGDFANG